MTSLNKGPKYAHFLLNNRKITNENIFLENPKIMKNKSAILQRKKKLHHIFAFTGHKTF